LPELLAEVSNATTYVLARPTVAVDPSGELMDVTRLSDPERETFLAAYQAATADTLGIENGQVVVVERASAAAARAFSSTGTDVVRQILEDPMHMVYVMNKEGTGVPGPGPTVWGDTDDDGIDIPGCGANAFLFWDFTSAVMGPTKGMSPNGPTELTAMNEAELAVHEGQHILDAFNGVLGSLKNRISERARAAVDGSVVIEAQPATEWRALDTENEFRADEMDRQMRVGFSQQ
jgi:hypothetical protein